MKNSWLYVLPLKGSYVHHYFCKCTYNFCINSTLNDVEDLESICPNCSNDYFIDAQEWDNGTRTKIWKQFFWEREEVANENAWGIELYFHIPRYCEVTQNVVIEKQSIFGALLSKRVGSKVQLQHKYPIVSRYSLYLDDRVQEVKKLLVQDVKEYLFQNLFTNRPSSIDWIKEIDMKKLSIDDKFTCIDYFLTHSHLKEMSIFHWKMPILQQYTTTYPTQEKMLSFILNHKAEKSIRKAFYKTYEESVSVTGYYPYSDFIFTRTIDDNNFLMQLLSIYPAVKQHIFSDETFYNAIEFINFLKLYYTEKQITRLFLKEMQEESTKRRALGNWKDTLRLVQIPDIFEYLNQYFLKVKLNTKNLHDEIIRVSHLAAFDKGEHSTLVYKTHQNESEVPVEDLEFRLPIDTVELSVWAKELHNCMFGYVNSIKRGSSIIYGVFRNNELLYAVELRATKIVQALGKFNRKIDDMDMSIINSWHSEFYIKLLSRRE